MSRRSSEAGSGLLGTALGLGVVLSFLLLSAHVLLNLWITSQIDAVASDAALDVALAGPARSRSVAEATAIARARASLGRYADQVQLGFEASPGDSVVIHVSAPGIRLLPAPLAGLLGIEGLDRRIVVQAEER